MEKNKILVALDFETFYSSADGYTLKKMTTEEYIRDERFTPLCIGIAADGFEPLSVPQKYLKDYLASLPWDTMQVVHHHAQFDGLILSHYYGHNPAVILDTMSMARACCFSRNTRLSLASLSELFGLPEKTVPYNLFDGKRWEDLTANVKSALCNGAAQDAANTLAIAKAMLNPKPEEHPTQAHIAEVFGIGGFPRQELVNIDWTTRCYTQPMLKGYVQGFKEIAENEETRKAKMLNDLGLTREDLSSNTKFANILEGLGVEVEYKINAKGERIPAVAKSDAFMKDLLEHDDSLVVDLVEARLAVKSTIRETRAWRMAAMAERGPMCVYYYPYGAQNTLRHSGGDKFNWQNLERKGPIRKCIQAPKGYKLIIADKSQIECRLLNTASGQWDVVERFRNGEDIYCYNASALYGFEVTKEKHPKERGTGKQIELSCGFGCGGKKFVATAALGIYGPPIDLTLSEGEYAVRFYRDGHPNVVHQWETGDEILDYWAKFGMYGSEFELMGIKYKDGLALLPSGLRLDYRTVAWDPSLKQYFFHHKRSFARNVDSDAPDHPQQRWEWWYKRGYRTLYGAKMVEQLTQALAGVDYRQTCARLYIMYKLRPAMSSHDEAVYVVREDVAEAAREVIYREFAKAPTWLPGMPAEAEVKISDVYDK